MRHHFINAVVGMIANFLFSLHYGGRGRDVQKRFRAGGSVQHNMGLCCTNLTGGGMADLQTIEVGDALLSRSKNRNMTTERVWDG